MTKHQEQEAQLDEEILIHESTKNIMNNPSMYLFDISSLILKKFAIDKGEDVVCFYCGSELDVEGKGVLPDEHVEGCPVLTSYYFVGDMQSAMIMAAEEMARENESISDKIDKHRKTTDKLIKTLAEDYEASKEVKLH
jgi:hypothetical protein